MLNSKNLAFTVASQIVEVGNDSVVIRFYTPGFDLCPFASVTLTPTQANDLRKSLEAAVGAFDESLQVRRLIEPREHEAAE